MDGDRPKDVVRPRASQAVTVRSAALLASPLLSRTSVPQGIAESRSRGVRLPCALSGLFAGA